MPTYKLTWRDPSRPQDPDHFPEDADPSDLITYALFETAFTERIPSRLLSIEAALEAAGYEDVELLVKEESWKVPLNHSSSARAKWEEEGKPVDSNGCYTLPNGDCIADGDCIHHQS